MKKRTLHRAFGLMFGALMSSLVYANPQQALNLEAFAPEDYQYLAQKIFKNEANSNPKYLTHWNEGEGFPSMGIGHFIWLPESLKQGQVVFEETFPQMVAFVSHKSPPPMWLKTLNPFEVPWENKAEFDGAWSKIELLELRKWLLETQAAQAEFIAQQFQSKWQTKIASLPIAQQRKLRQALNELMQSKQGLFAVLDYYNFKGLGFNPKEQYQDNGWGLMDVLIDVPSSSNASEALNNFVISAKHRLTQRVQNSPIARNENRWLKGWFVRLDHYLLLDESRKSS